MADQSTGTYADESPDASIGERIKNSVGKIIHAVAPASVTHIQPRTDTAVADQDQASNAGSQAQSTDSYNKY